jgi:glycosyltransferase involved in cell wall biosynthesis
VTFLRIISTLDPAYGGPVEGLRQSVQALALLGYPNEVVTLDSQDAPWLDSFPAPVKALGPSLGKYCYTPHLLPWLERETARYDAVIVEGIWQYHSFATWLASRKARFSYHIFPHGALDPWFRQQYPLKHLKKWLYWPWADYQVLRDARTVLFTSEEERRLATQSFWLYQANEKVISFGILSPPLDTPVQKQSFFQAFPALANKRFLLFLGRIHIKKGCDLLLQAFSHLATRYPDLMLVIAGPDAENTRPVLEQMARSLGIIERVVWTGLLTGNKKWGALCAADAFVLPSHSENFGVAVVEALACGTPVLISNKVNIWKEIESCQAGLIAPDTLDGTINLLERWFQLGVDSQAALRSRARPCFEKNFEVQTSAAKLIQTVQGS